MVNDFYKRVEKLREDLLLGKGEFSEKFGVKSANYSTLLKGKTINGELSKTLNKEFGVNLNWLITGVGEMYSTETTPNPCTHTQIIRKSIDIVLDMQTYSDNRDVVFLSAVTPKGIESREKVVLEYLSELGKIVKVVELKDKTEIEFYHEFGVLDGYINLDLLSDEEIEEFHKAFMAENITHDELYKKFGVSFSYEEMWGKLQNNLYNSDIVWVIKELSHSKLKNYNSLDAKGLMARGLIKIIDNAHFKGIVPKSNLIFIDYASFLESSYEYIGGYIKGNLMS